MFIGLTYAALALPAFAEAPPAPMNAAKIKEVEAYLNGLATFAARFEQNIASGMQPSSGMFYFKRPSRFLWQYETPDPVKLVSGGGIIYFYDESNNQVNQVPREGIADFLTRPKIQLSEGPFKVVHLQDVGGLLHVGIQLKGESVGDIGNNLTLTFLQNPLQLRQITTTNQFDQPVEVLFYSIKENIPLANQLFDFTPPHYQER